MHLFKSKKPGTPGAGIPPSSRKLTSRDGPNGTPPGGYGALQSDSDRSRSGSGGAGPIPGAGAMNARSAPSPTPGQRHPVPRGQMMAPMRQVPQRPGQQPPDASLYPWSNHHFSFYDSLSPLPRYGASINGEGSRHNEIFMMGGLVDGATVKGDLWVVEAGTYPLKCYQVETSNEGPGPRVGHACLVAGNAFIVFGGDTKIDDHDVLDDTLYLLNIDGKHWSRVAPAGPRPCGRYGHTMNLIGSRIFVFGGQVDGYFFNDLLAFDLNGLQGQKSSWEILVQNTLDGGPPQGQSPPARTNHTVVTYDEKLYLFGGTDGQRWFSDVWVYDPRTNSWTCLDCIGFIPAAREGHAAALVGDVMYTFGGRTDEGKDLGDVAGFRIPTRRWYTFQNMGPSPSPRSGHGMTAVDDKIIVLGGEPSSAPRNEQELSEGYVLDTSKIRYPDEKPAPKAGVVRRPSISDRSGTPQQDRASSRDGSISSQQGNRNLTTKGSQDSMASSTAQYSRPQDAPSTGYVNGIMQRPTRSAPSPVPNQVAPQPAAQQLRTNGIRSGAQSSVIEGRESPRLISKLDKLMGVDQPDRDTSSANAMQPRDAGGMQPSTGNEYNPSQDDTFGPNQVYANQQQQPPDNAQRRGTETPETGTRGADDFMQSSFKQPAYADSGVGSSPAMSTQQPDSLSRELDASRSKNAWYESELALAKKAGFRSSSLDTPNTPLDDKNANAFGDDEKPLLEALLRMRAELVRVQESLEAQSATAAEKMAQAEREKEMAVAEALYARNQLNSRGQSTENNSAAFARLDEANHRLASTIEAHNDLQQQVRTLSQSLAAEKQARENAEGSAEVAHARALDLDNNKQRSSPEMDSLRAQLAELQRTARADAETHAEALASSRSLGVDNQELATKLASSQDKQRTHIGVLSTLRDAVTASNNKTALIERQLDAERQQRTVAEEKLVQLRSEHEARVSELDASTRQLRDLQDLADSHADEARTHREAVLAGLGTTVDRNYDPTDANDERVLILQQQVEDANARAQQLKEQTNNEAEKRRSAEERIAGLEAFQEQQTREALSSRKQLQSTTRDHLTLQSDHADLQQQLSKHQLELTAWQMHHESLKGVLADRGVDTSSLPKDMKDFQPNSGNNKRLQQLEEQIEASTRSQDEMRQTYETREQELRQTRDVEYRALEKECQQMRSGIEKFNTIAGQMKKELDRQKEKNRGLKEELEQERRSRSAASGDQNTAAEFEGERTKYRQLIENLQIQQQRLQAELESQVRKVQSVMSERDTHQSHNVQLQRELAGSQAATSDLERLRTENEELRARTTEAENRAQVLLRQVGSSVNTYKRQSQSLTQAGGHSRGMSLNSIGGESNYSSPSIAHDASGDRTSMAQMEAMMNELDNIRGDFERQRQGYSDNRLSTGSVLEGTGPSAHESAIDDSSNGKVDSLADMRRRHLSFNDDEDLDDARTIATAQQGRA